MSLSVSTSGAFSLLQTSVTRVRVDLATAQAELASGKPADYGLTLGAGTSVLVGLRQQQDRLVTIQQTNGIARARLDSTASILDSLMSDARTFLQKTVQNDPAAVTPQVVQQQARDGLAALRQALNTIVAGQAIFGGIDVDRQVMPQDPTAPGGVADGAFQSAFTSAFGFSSTSPNVSFLDASQVSGFLQGSFQNLFSAASWQAGWSNANDTPLTSRIGLTRIIDSSVSGNEKAIVDLAKAYATIVDMPLAQMTPSAGSAAIRVAATNASNAVDGLTALQARVGTMRADIEASDKAIALQIDTLTIAGENLAPVDPYATSSRVTELQTQLQTAYTLTAQLQKLSLAQYL